MNEHVHLASCQPRAVPFGRPRSVAVYGFDEGALIEQPGSPSGFLLDWQAIDAHTTALSRRQACEYVVVGETVRCDGTVFPELQLNPDYLTDVVGGFGYSPGGRLRPTCEDCGLAGDHMPTCQTLRKRSRRAA